MAGKLRKAPGQKRARTAYVKALRALTLWPNVSRTLLSQLVDVLRDLDRELESQESPQSQAQFVVRCLCCEADHDLLGQPLGLEQWHG